MYPYDNFPNSVPPVVVEDPDQHRFEDNGGPAWVEPDSICACTPDAAMPDEEWTAPQPIAETTTTQVISSDSEDDELLLGVEKMYSTIDAAAFFPGKRKPSKSNQWLYWGMRNKIFVYPDGSVIEPLKVGRGNRCRFSLTIIREIALSCYRRGNLKEDALREVFRRILMAEYGESSFQQPVDAELS